MPKHCRASSIITKSESTCECSACVPKCSTKSSSSTCSTKTCTPTCSSNTCIQTCSSNTCTPTCSSSTHCSTTCSSTSSSSSSCSSYSSTDGSSCSSSSNDVILGKKKFNVEFKSKCGHDHESEIVGDKAIYVNGKLAPILKLRRGYVYYFNVKQKGCENSFVLTKNPVGRYHDISPEPLCDSFDPVTHGCVKYHVTCKTPKYFYYQSASAAFMGGLVLVEDNIA